VTNNRHGDRRGPLGLALSLNLLLAACGTEGIQDPPSAAAEPVVAATVAVPGNAAPLIQGTPATDATVGLAYTFQASASDADGDTLTFSVQGLPAWATLDAGTGRISGTPAAADAGVSADIELAVTDGKQTAALPAFRLTIGGAQAPAPATPGTAAPQIGGSPATNLAAGKAWSFTPGATDADSLTLTFSISNKPAWASFSSATGTLSGTPSAKQVGSYANILIRVSDGSHEAALPAFTLVVQAPPNNAPTISGTPATSATVGRAYAFTPSAADADQQALGFSITNKPAWAAFNTATGALTGTPGSANVGAFSNIVISVSDGKSFATLPPFSILVSSATTGSAVLAWTPPTQNTDGTILSNLAGYRIYYGADPQALTTRIEVTNPGVTVYTVGNLKQGTHYFSVSAYTSDGVESAASPIGSKTIL
jgi:hypothetical protein